MRLLIPLSVLLTVCYCVTFDDILLTEWETFKIQYNKTYRSPEEDKFRLKIFRDNRYKIANHNAEYARGLVTYELAVNRFADMFPHEVKRKMYGFKYNKEAPRKGSTFFTPENVVIPKELDWRKHGYVTPVKDQGDCGSCWAFSSTGSLEGQHFRKTRRLVSLSEQNLVDCSTPEGNEGCNGGMMDSAFEYVKINGGIDTEESYPYTAQDGHCKFKPDTVGATVTGWVDVPPGNETILQEAVATVGPISIAIDATLRFQFYLSGVFYDIRCKSTEDDLDHEVLVVGYGTSKEGEDYWLVKNSWGNDWGENGYIRMSRNRNNNCGIASLASYPLV